jgi:2'-5' RNA ligase
MRSMNEWNVKGAFGGLQRSPTSVEMRSLSDFPAPEVPNVHYSGTNDNALIFTTPLTSISPLFNRRFGSAGAGFSSVSRSFYRHWAALQPRNSENPNLPDDSSSTTGNLKKTLSKSNNIRFVTSTNAFCGLRRSPTSVEMRSLSDFPAPEVPNVHSHPIFQPLRSPLKSSLSKIRLS